MWATTAKATASPTKRGLCESNRNTDIDDFTNSSILEFLNKERECLTSRDADDESDVDVESLFEEINRLSDSTDERSVEELLREAETLIRQQQPLTGVGLSVTNRNAISEPNASFINRNGDGDMQPQVSVTKAQQQNFKSVVEAVCPDSIISEESTPKDMRSDDDDSPTLDLTESIGIISLQIDEQPSEPGLDGSNILAPTSHKPHSRRNSSETPATQFTALSVESLPLAREAATINKVVRLTSMEKSFCDQSSSPSPTHLVSHVAISPIDNFSISREYALKHEIEVLQEKLKDTEERLQSLRIQHDSLSDLHRDLRENHTRLQEESDLLKLDVQHLTECANILRSELQAARNDRDEALDVQKLLQTELDDSRCEKKRAQEQNQCDTKIIQDLKRQCREMERILMRKYPDSVSALIVAAKNPPKASDECSGSRRLLEQRIAQLEADAKEQDHKAQKILASVQARFNSVQEKYETHIADLETQVLSLQEINTKLNEKIETQMKLLNKPCKDDSGIVNNSTQTDDLPEIRSSSTQTDTSRPNSSISSRIPSKKLQTNKMSISHSDSTISTYHATAREDAHLLATVRGMRIDLALKDKAIQRLTRELEECKKTMKRLQKEKEAIKFEKPSSIFSSSTNSRRHYDPNQFTEQTANSQSLKEALNKIKLLESDYKVLHNKRLQDLKTLQAAHERELTTCQGSIRVLQQRLAERDEAFTMQKHRKVPIDYYALKAKVSSLERRHSEREQRLHMLVEALSKGRLNGALEEILTDNDQ